MNMNELYANYTASCYWDLDGKGIDLETAHEWSVKWNILYVQKEENGDIEEYDCPEEQECDYKYPTSLWLNHEEINIYTMEKEAA
jgi:hypothetical protein